MIDVVALTGRSVDLPYETPFLPALDTPYIVGTRLDHVIDTSGQGCGAIYSGYGPGDPFAHEATHRYVLWRVWDHDKLPLVVIGLNPSTATHLVLDPTCRRDIRYARDWGFGGLVKLNLHSYRSTDPKALHSWGCAGSYNSLWGINDDYLKWYTHEQRAGLVLAAWGVHGALYGRGYRVMQMLSEEGVRLFAVAETKDGHPRHTLYTRANLNPIPYLGQSILD